VSQPESSFEEFAAEGPFAEETFSEEEHLAAPAETRAEAPRGILVPRPRTSIYTVLLGISACALAIGCLLLVLEIWQYGPPWTFPWKIPTNFR
jgi:hypothetical protein